MKKGEVGLVMMLITVGLGLALSSSSSRDYYEYDRDRWNPLASYRTASSLSMVLNRVRSSIVLPVDGNVYPSGYDCLNTECIRNCILENDRKSSSRFLILLV
ncbi:hypothetical protein CDL15_Pgr000050 [Punica granatum]|uniref:Gnk2-homologous domain-containing protein n=1 Tax=Punica granatum TaxID=22663 RepID=A0A218VQF5_PUNGR|nr:hypothetical protein CDL15_Pgr000050 [Punica granatum]